ncbi:MAG TPA: MFS transporter [Candidatus Angelobacter sp.]|nr:MFS transporter [Candidatus Angelobacter sp.]
MKTPCDEIAMQSCHTDASPDSRAQPWILVATILGSSMAFIDSTVANVALPALQSSLNASVVDAQWVVESYGLFLGALILVGGSMGDLFGRRRMYLAGISVFTLASVACGLAANIQQLITARAVQGVGAAFLVPGSLALIGASFNEKDRGRAIGTWSGFTAITTGFGPVLGGWLIQHASWRWAFFMNVPIAVAVLVICVWHVPESKRPGIGHIDWAGALLATLGLGGIVYALVESPVLGWKQPLVIVPAIAGSVCLLTFLRVESRSSSPMVSLKLFKSKTFSGANLITLFLYAALGIFFFLLPLNLIQVQGYSPSAAGAAGLPFIVLMFSLSRWSGGLVNQYGPRAPLIFGPLLSAAGFLLFAVPSLGHSYWTTFFPAYVVLGLGMAITVPPLTTIVMQAVAQGHSGAASGINNAVARVAGLLAIAVFGVTMLAAFQSYLHRELARLSISPQAQQEIQENELKLAALPLPSSLGAEDRAAVKGAIDHAFIFGFRLVLVICSALAGVCAIFSWLLIEVQATKIAYRQ